MGIFINTNAASLSARRNLDRSGLQLGRNMTRLSSGMRITSAGEDAAGLAISERFTSNIRGMDRAVRNANDAISLSQVAEAALGESTQILQRMRELAVQSASDINSVSDREALNAEIEQLKEELTRIGDTTTFNGTKILDGSYVNAYFQVGAYAGDTVRLGVSDTRSANLAAYATKTGAPVSTNGVQIGDLLVNGVTIRATNPTDDMLSSTASTGSAIAKARAINDTTEYHGVTARAMPTEFISADPIGGGTLDQNNYIEINGHRVTGIDVFGSDSTESLLRTINGYVDETGVMASLDIRGHVQLTAEDGRNIELTTVGNGGVITGMGANSITTAQLNFASEDQIILSGANESFVGFADNEMIAVTSAEAVGTVNVLTRFDSNEALLRIDRAIEQITGDRAEIGAVANRMQSTVNNLSAILEHSEVARSRIADADFAQESSKMSKNQVLQQAGISILSQANSLPQQAMQLLQG
jgi:flagellin